MSMRFHSVVLALVIAASCCAADATDAQPTPLQQAARKMAALPRAPMVARDVFLREPVVRDVHLSPDGRMLSFVRRDAGRDAVWWVDLASGTQARLLPDVGNVSQAWSGDGRRLWVADAHGLAVVERTDSRAKRLVKWDGTRRQRFFGVDANAPAIALVSESLDGGRRHRTLGVDNLGHTRVLYQAAWPLRHALLASDGALAYAAVYDGPNYDTSIRQYTPKGVRELARCTGVVACQPVAYDARRGALWMLAQHNADKQVLQRWQAGRWETVHRDPIGIADADALLWNPARNDWTAIAYDGDTRHWYGNDAQARAHLAALRRHFPAARLELSTTADGRLWLVRAQQSNWVFPQHYLYRLDGDRLQRLFAREDAAARPPSPHSLAIARPFHWRARDGMQLHGYVYLPRGIATAKAPLIAWLHGGPFSRFDDRYDPRVQLLVNRGYAVFLPNFRASTGYGLRYMRAAQGDVGNGRVLHDVLDGLDALLAQGIGDRKRQAVMGHSFGGYASLLAVSHAPTRFRFALAGAAPTDYGWVKRWQVDNESLALRGDGPPVSVSFPQHGLPFADPAWRARMRRDSPLATLPRLRVPVYLWAGAKDDRTPLKSVIHYASEARRLGKPVGLLVDPGAGHVPDDALGADAWMYLMERVADRHFGGGVTPPSARLDAFLRQGVRIDTHGALGSRR